MISVIHHSNRSLDYSLECTYIMTPEMKMDCRWMYNNVKGMNKSVLVAMTMTAAVVVQLMLERDGGVHH